MELIPVLRDTESRSMRRAAIYELYYIQFIDVDRYHGMEDLGAKGHQD